MVFSRAKIVLRSRRERKGYFGGFIREFEAENLGKLLRVLAAEHPVFQFHVLTLVQEAIVDPDTLARAVTRLHESFPAKVLEDFIASLPAAGGNPLPSGPPEELLSLADKAPASGLVALVAGELLHRKAWDEALARHPDTLRILKERLIS